MPTVQGRQYEGYLEATNYLIDKGYKNIAYCTGSRMVALQELGVNVNSDRYRGYAEAMSNHGLAANPAFIYTNVRTFEDGQYLVREFAEMANRPDAIISGSDQVAAGMVFAAEQQGMRIPDDLAIMGMDDQPIATQIAVPLTTIRQPIEAEGRMAAEELVRRLSGDDGRITRHKLDLTPVVRQSA